MKRHHLLFLFAAFIAITSSAQKLDNLVELKQKSENPLFHHLDKAPRTPAFECEGYWAWGSSVVKGDDGKYHMFVSRFPKSLPFHPGWMVASEIVHAVSEIPQGPYRFSEVALPARGAQYWDGRSTHNPRILRQNGKYYLIYMGSTHPFADPTYEQLTLKSPWCTVARANKRVGLAVADSLTVEWEDGSVEKQGQLERPFILFEDGKPAYIFFATMDGPGGFENASRSWNMVIPIKDRK